VVTAKSTARGNVITHVGQKCGAGSKRGGKDGRQASRQTQFDNILLMDYAGTDVLLSDRDPFTNKDPRNKRKGHIIYLSLSQTFCLGLSPKALNSHFARMTSNKPYTQMTARRHGIGNYMFLRWSIASLL
jgi:hypothetical protein